LAYRLWLEGAEPNIVVMPFDRILAAVAAGEVDAGLIIHEGQLTYRDLGLRLVVDLGVWWQSDTGLPLPLGGNVVRKDLGPAALRDIARLLEASIRYSLEHRQPALDYALGYARDMGRDLADRFVGMYVNQWTLDYGPRGRAAIAEFLRRGVAAGLVAGPATVEFVDAA
jgi:1,4-dihydroxy-6-naphthoate synthase